MRLRRRTTSKPPAGSGEATLRDSLRAALRDLVGPVARAHGFKGSAPNWRRSTDLGDWAIVNVQSSRYSTREYLRCVINLSVAPEPWLAWRVASKGPVAEGR